MKKSWVVIGMILCGTVFSTSAVAEVMSNDELTQRFEQLEERLKASEGGEGGSGRMGRSDHHQRRR